MKSTTLLCFLDLLTFTRSSFSTTRTQICFPRKLFYCKAKHGRELFYCKAKHDGSLSIRLVPQNQLVAEKEEAKAVLTLFFRKRGLTNAIAARSINKADLFVDHLVSKLHYVHRSRYLVGRELTTLEIRDALIPYLETLFEEYGNLIVDLVENFPTKPVNESSDEHFTKEIVRERPVEPISVPTATLDPKKLKALGRVCNIGPAGKLPPHITYLINLGMDLALIKTVIRKFPAFAYYSLDGKIRPFIEFLIDLGVPKSDIPTILSKRPQLCGISLSENVIPTMKFLEGLGVDKKQWAKVIYRFPALLTYSRPKLNSTVDFLHEMGLSAESVGKILTRFPHIIGYSVEDKLRPTAEYFRSLGVDVEVLLTRCPQTFGLSIETHLKPMAEFFFEKGYSIKEVGTMISRYGALCTFSLANNLIPKWEFFLTMCYPKSELVKFPQYFGYSLEERIKPRYSIVAESGARLLLNQMLSLSEDEFGKVLKKKLKKMLVE